MNRKKTLLKYTDEAGLGDVEVLRHVICELDKELRTLKMKVWNLEKSLVTNVKLEGTRFANCNGHGSGMTTRVMCPDCGSSGGHPVKMQQPYCSHCKDPRVLMEPACNTHIVCTWKELMEYLNL